MTVETYLLFVAPLLVLGFGASVMAFHEMQHRRAEARLVKVRAARNVRR
ncbi:hypothetical protein [Hansschlegelia zhihuaiae]|nr:hypothetical protein [Hansschlegelia zhihuaiae]